MFRILFFVSIVACVIGLIAMIVGSCTFEMLLSCLVSVIVFGVLQSFQTKVEESFRIHNSIIMGLQERCNKLEKEVEKLKNKK